MAGIWVNVSIPGGQAGVAGPFSGQGQFDLIQAGIHTYTTQADAQASSPQTLDANQVHVFEQVVLQGPGIGSGFFGLQQNVQQLPGAIASDVSSALNPFGFLSQASFWLRTGEVLIGVVLIAIGLNAMLKGRPLAVVTTAAGGIGKVVP